MKILLTFFLVLFLLMSLFFLYRVTIHIWNSEFNFKGEKLIQSLSGLVVFGWLIDNIEWVIKHINELWVK